MSSSYLNAGFQGFVCLFLSYWHSMFKHHSPTPLFTHLNRQVYTINQVHLWVIKLMYSSGKWLNLEGVGFFYYYYYC